MYPTTEGQEARNAYTDWLLRQEDEHELKSETKAEQKREDMRYQDHKFWYSELTPGFCGKCSVNEKFHDQPPYGRKAQ